MTLGDLVRVLGPSNLGPQGLGLITSNETMSRWGKKKIHVYYEVMIDQDVIVVHENFLELIEKAIY